MEGFPHTAIHDAESSPLSPDITIDLNADAIPPVAFDAYTPPKPRTEPERYPFLLEEGLEKDFVQFCGVLREVVLDVLLPFDIPRTELTSVPGTDPNDPINHEFRKPSIHEYF